MARTPVMAAGGIVLRQEKTPLIAVVRLRKRNEWVLPKGKLDDGETPRAAAEREVLEETGHDVAVHEFLGTLVYESGGGFKVVHYWRMEADDEPAHELMHDVKAVDWLPLDAAVERLSRGYERAFLANVGPIALQAAASVETRRTRARKPSPEKRRSRRVVPQAPVSAPEILAPVVSEPAPVISEQVPATPPSDYVASVPDEVLPNEVVQNEVAPDEVELAASDAVEAELPVDAEAPLDTTEPEIIPESAEPGHVAAPAALESAERDASNTDQHGRKNLVQKMRDWLWRAA
jgi:8-oxo-dGTP diphosphatase